MPPPSPHAQTLGRYRLLGEIATGGMSEVLLAKLDGPSGFEKLVAVKRILPHLARRKDFVRMFEDEARLVARISHPNVVQVHELVADQGSLHLIMEYLEGETVSSVLRRGRPPAAPIPFALAAFVIAEAAAGLHAAHELVGDDGTPLDLVHRDVSPQNIVVTHDGHVKILDFGIAVFANRRVQTESGHVKGKYQYMSPEQCSGQRLDRRSDIFSLGAVLYELTTGHSLFARDTPAETFRAIQEEPILPPSRTRDDYPAELERICLRALEHSPDARYPTAFAMRRELLGIVRRVDSDPSEMLIDTMNALFPERIRERAQLVERARANREIGSIPSGEVDPDVELPRATTRMVVAPVSPPRAASAERRPRILVAASLLIGGIALAAFWRPRLETPQAISPTPHAEPSEEPSSSKSAVVDASTTSAIPGPSGTIATPSVTSSARTTPRVKRPAGAVPSERATPPPYSKGPLFHRF